MKYSHHSFPTYTVEVEASTFQGKGNVTEHHLMLHVTDAFKPYTHQLESLHQALQEMLDTVYGGQAIPVLKRYFLSDASNQTEALQQALQSQAPCAVSIVQQSPLDGSKVALWVYLQEGMGSLATSADGTTHTLQHNGYEHLWTVCRPDRSENSELQTSRLLENYEADLQARGCHIADNCVRTWFFVRDVDVNYGGVVKGRKDNFNTVGLTQQTHYIASTGIEGRHADHSVKVLLDAYAVKGIKPEQMTYLYAPTHLNPTYEYGVTFERGVCMEYGDRKQLYISGTASIDNKGHVLHVGDIVAQTERMWENVEKLLEERHCTFDDLAQAIVYLRDVADYPIVKQMYEKRLPGVPITIVLAPVCRPSWLIEMECIAIKENNSPYPAL